jgi:superfamily II DNA or RNA helicase
MKLTLADYQLKAKDWITSRDRSALFMGMGMGKTATVLSGVNDLMLDGLCSGTLVVAPLRVSTLTWPHEIKRWFPAMRVSDLRTAAGMADLRRGRSHIYTINYEALPKLAKEYMFNRRKFAFDTVVFDELTRAKNPKSKRMRAFKPYLDKVPRRIGLTGTPVPNSLLDLWAQVHLLDGGERLGASFAKYRDTYFESDYMGYKYVARPAPEQAIYNKLRDLALTVRASDYLDVPDTIYEDIEVPLPRQAVATYKTLEKELLVLLESSNVEVVAVNAAVLVNKLLQVTGGNLYDGDKKAHHIHDAKVMALRKLVARVKEPVLIACNFKHERAQILKHIPGCVEWSDNLMEPWNRGEVPAIVAHPASIGHGLNLQDGGRTIIWYGLNWSRENYDQMNSRVCGARAARTGRQPQVFRLITPGTADEAVAEALRLKDQGQQALLSALASIREMAR